jgi:alpha-galactosidase
MDAKAFWQEKLSAVLNGAELAAGVPFSFIYDGKRSADFISSWEFTCERLPETDDKETQILTYTDPTTGLQVACEITSFSGFPAVEWVIGFTNNGSADTPVIEDILPLDLQADVPPTGDIILHCVHDSNISATDHLPVDIAVAPNTQLDLTPHALIPPVKDMPELIPGYIPFFNLEWDGGGLFTAIGWTGHWSFSLKRNEAGGLALASGQQSVHLKLHPGESTRTPRILLIGWQGDDRMLGHNLLGRLMLTHYAPRVDGEAIMPPVTFCAFFYTGWGNSVTEQNQVDSIRGLPPVGMEGFWLDAGWFEGGWPDGAGSWVPKAEAFPNGLKPLGDAAHERGLSFVLWVEPERVTPNSLIAKEQSEWVMHHPDDSDKGRLFNLGEPAARKWMTDLLSRCTHRSFGISIHTPSEASAVRE